jgi:hypothetical protein
MTKHHEIARQPVIKGLRRLHYPDIDQELSAARRSPYYWWWRYLRLSTDYWWVCRQNGKTLDKRLHEVWRDFGDVFNRPFSVWWREHGRNLFAEQVQLPHVRQIDPRVVARNADADNHVLVEIPLNLTERTIAKQVLAIIRDHPNRRINPVSHAKRQLCTLRGIRQAVIEDAHMIWCINHVVEQAKLSDSPSLDDLRRMSHHQIGVRLRLVQSCMPARTDSDDKERKKRNGMKVAVTRMLTRANALIANAAIGVFPSTVAVAPMRRWTATQQKGLDQAIASGEVQLPDVDIGEVRTILKLQGRLPG